jgi:hypothetical protein
MSRWISWMRRSRKSSVDDAARLSRITPLLWAIGILSLLDLVSPSGWAGAAERIAGQLSVRDALTVPGRAVRLEARLVRKGLFGEAGLGGEQLEFLIGDKRAGTAMTGGDGRAFLEYTPRMRGTQVLTVRLVSKKRIESPDATATLACWERRRPILLVDLAALIEEPGPPAIPTPSLPLKLGHQERPAPMHDAAVELKRLTDYFFNVIYLVQSGDEEDSVRDEAREWLKRHGLPIGLLMVVKPGRAFLGEFIDSLRREGWGNLKAGIGRTRDFAEVLVDRRLQAVILPASTKDEDLPRKARAVKDWKEVRRLLQG